jgi:hypothetical protein
VKDTGLAVTGGSFGGSPSIAAGLTASNPIYGGLLGPVPFTSEIPRSGSVAALLSAVEAGYVELIFTYVAGDDEDNVYYWKQMVPSTAYGVVGHAVYAGAPSRVRLLSPDDGRVLHEVNGGRNLFEDTFGGGVRVG